jgi:hypothetical protein
MKRIDAETSSEWKKIAENERCTLRSVESAASGDV